MSRSALLALLGVVVGWPAAASGQVVMGGAVDPRGDGIEGDLEPSRDIRSLTGSYDRVTGVTDFHAVMDGHVRNRDAQYDFVVGLLYDPPGPDPETCGTYFDGMLVIAKSLPQPGPQTFPRGPVYALSTPGAPDPASGPATAKAEGTSFRVRVTPLDAFSRAGLQGRPWNCMGLYVRPQGLPLGPMPPALTRDFLDVPLRLAPKKSTPKVSLRSTLTRDPYKPFRYRGSGTVILPAGGVEKATACTGEVFLSLERGPVTVGATTVKVKPDCTYAKTVSVIGKAKLAKRNGRTSGTLKLGARFAGNTLLNAKSAPSMTVRYGSR